MYMLQAGGVVLLVGDSTGLEFRKVASKGASQPFIMCMFGLYDQLSFSSCLSTGFSWSDFVRRGFKTPNYFRPPII